MQNEEAQVSEVIRQVDGKWFLFDAKGEKRIAGPFDTQEDALKVERAIQAQKANESVITKQGSVQSLLDSQSKSGTQNWDVQRIVLSKESFPLGLAFRYMEDNEIKGGEVRDTLDAHVFECAPREKFQELHHFINPLSGVKIVLGRL